ncbi:MAG: glycine cleavage system protein [Enterobacter mori]|nr:glycine cleavage system protein [Enterobacter mori]
MFAPVSRSPNHFYQENFNEQCASRTEIQQGTTVSAGDDCAVAESVKAASDIYAPVSGEIVAVNDALSDSPELVNSEPYEGGWIFKIKASDESQVAALLDATAYEALLEDE